MFGLSHDLKHFTLLEDHSANSPDEKLFRNQDNGPWKIPYSADTSPELIINANSGN
ncbi:MAG: hypothetical protein KO316_02185 [Methanobacterium sp.]|nr:hypothetical protein [Methanobacterium sp.]